MSIYILRHGQTEWNLARRMQGRLDSPLTETGRAQAARQGAILRGLDLPPGTQFLTSPQQRARQTARIALAGLCDAPRVDPRLCEVSMGVCEGLTHEEIRARLPGLIGEGADFAWYFDAPGAETQAQLSARCGAFLSDLRGPTVIVTHGITSRFLRAHLTGTDWRDLGDPEGGQGVVYEIRAGAQRRHPPLPSLRGAE